ncbi:MAG: GNAT family N-acetyltransferase [Clostridiales bacterium]|nr:GNAT family N-acetyltransferase [Clostridiales bacterium]
MESKNILLRNTCFDDFKHFAEWETQSQVTDYLSIGESRSYEEIVRESILWESDPSKRQLTIVLKEEGAPIGRVLISRLDRESDSLDITRIYIADERHRGKGFGEETMLLILEYSFMGLHMERVTLDHYTGNAVASSLYQKLGFQYEGVARNACKKNGKYYDVNLMSMTRAEYFEKVHVKKY